MLHDPIHTRLDEELRSRQSEYSSFSPGLIWAGTFNLNGRPPGTESLLPWLFPDPCESVCAFKLSSQHFHFSDLAVVQLSSPTSWLLASKK